MAKIVVDGNEKDHNVKMSDVPVGTIFTWGYGIDFYIRTKHELHNIESGCKKLVDSDSVFNDYREVREVVLRFK